MRIHNHNKLFRMSDEVKDILLLTDITKKKKKTNVRLSGSVCDHNSDRSILTKLAKNVSIAR